MNILLIDDDLKFCETFTDFAEIHYQITLTYFHNHTDGFAELRKNPTYKAIILDARCFRTPEDQAKGGDGNRKALDFALKLYDNFTKETNRYLPFAVYTAYSEDFADFFDLETRKSQIFTKGKDQDRLLNYLKTQIQNSENYQIERQYTDVFEVFEKGFLGQSEKNDLLTVLKNINQVSTTEVEQNIHLLRTLKERIIATNDESNAPFAIKKFCEDIRQISNKYASHKTLQDIELSHYAAKSLTYALLEVLLWFKSEMQK